MTYCRSKHVAQYNIATLLSNKESCAETYLPIKNKLLTITRNNIGLLSRGKQKQKHFCTLLSSISHLTFPRKYFYQMTSANTYVSQISVTNVLAWDFHDRVQSIFLCLDSERFPFPNFWCTSTEGIATKWLLSFITKQHSLFTFRTVCFLTYRYCQNDCIH